MRDADNTAIHVRGIPSTLLMTNAAQHVVSAAAEIARTREAYIFCGSGNNGGDGVAAAFLLMRRGFRVRALLVGSREKMTADTSEMERRLREVGGALEDFDADEPNLAEALDKTGVIIDAMYGIGLNSALRGKGLAAAKMINAASAPVVSADIASGVEADTGRILGEAVRADITVTFSLAKPGHFAEPGCTCGGEIRIADIGIPKDCVSAAGTETFAVTQSDVSLPRRAEISHKSDYGKLLIIGGCVGYTGAPSLCAHAAVRSGAGLVYLGVPQEIYGITAVKNAEAMPFPLPSEGGKLSYDARRELLARLETCDTAVLGCGLGRSEAISALVSEAVEKSKCRLVIDADGLFAIGGQPDVLRRAAMPVVLTPHEGEFARLGGVLSGDRQADARSFAQKYGCILVLKGHRTVVAFPSGEVYIICAGNAGMAKGGSGDALAGVIGAMLCQLPEKDAVVTAAWLHASAGDIAREKYGEYSMTPSDLIDALPAATQEILL
jgi:NAD(P)H-hydrate epimerase